MSKFFQSISHWFNVSLAYIFPKSPTEDIDMSKFNETPVFADEFNGDSLDMRIWNDHASTNGVRRGGYWDKDMVSVKNGNLIIKTAYLKDGLNGKPAGWYTAGIDTKNSFEHCYGYYECRCILPKGYGHWSAFWLMSDGVNHIDGSGKDGSEIDIMESPFWGNKRLQNTTMHTIHYDGYGKAHKSQGSPNWKINGDPYSEFHTYGLEWNKNGYTFYIDGKKTTTTNFGGASQVPEYLILSVEVAGKNGIPSKDFSVGVIDDNEGSKDFTSEFIIDYVRVYQYK